MPQRPSPDASKTASYRIRNWKQYNEALIRRGSLTLWVDQDTVQAWRYRGPTQRGAQFEYSNLAVECLLTLRPRERHEALQAARQQQETAEWKAEYATRAGIEGTLSQGVRGFGLRRRRSIGLAKAHLQHVITAAAMNLSRLAAWLEDAPEAKTRTSRFARLALAG